MYCLEWFAKTSPRIILRHLAARSASVFRYPSSSDKLYHRCHESILSSLSGKIWFSEQVIELAWSADVFHNRLLRNYSGIVSGAAAISRYYPDDEIWSFGVPRVYSRSLHLHLDEAETISFFETRDLKSWLCLKCVVKWEEFHSLSLRSEERKRRRFCKKSHIESLH